MKNFFLILIRCLLPFLLFLTACSNNVSPTSAGSTASGGEWSQTAAKITKAVYMIGFRKGDGEVSVLATGFAVSPHRIATNGHVAMAVPYALDYYGAYFREDLQLVAVPAVGPAGSYIPLNRFVLHQGFSGLLSPDFSLFETEALLSDTVTRASLSELEAVALADPIATVGFPGEIAFYLGYATPIPVYKDGSVSATIPFAPGVPSAPNYVIQHNFNLTGGTSGSPIFNREGKVVAINNSGLAGYSIGFGIRIDLLDYCMRQSITSSIYDLSLNEYYPWYVSWNSSYPAQIGEVAIGDSISRADSIFGVSRDTLLDSAADNLYRYTDGYSYEVSLLFHNKVLEGVLLTNTAGQERLNRFRNDDGALVTVGSNRASIDIMFGPADKRDTLDGIIFSHYAGYGVSFGFKIPDDGVCDALVLYPEEWQMPLQGRMHGADIPTANSVLKKCSVPARFGDVPPFQMPLHALCLSPRR
jgi:hypothetical protein